MKNIDILQKLIDNNGEYLLVQRYTKSYNQMSDDTWETLLVSPNIPYELQGKKLVDEPYKVVEKFSDTDARSCIHLGDNYSPFQYGMYYKDFIHAEKIDCKIMELITKCYTENITDYWKVLDVVKGLTKKN